MQAPSRGAGSQPAASRLVSTPRRVHAGILLGLAVLAILAYLPVFHQPLIQDDYPNIEQSREFGPVSGWPSLLSNGVFRYRATWYVVTHWVDRWFESPAAFYAVSLVLHILCVWLVYALGAWRLIGWRISPVAAAFFAVHEGHQEAVMWYSASAELLMFLFGALSLLCWARVVDKKGGWKWYAASLLSFVAALLSKESAVAFAALLVLPLLGSRAARRALLWWLPFGALAAADQRLIFSGRAYSFRFHDGSFSLAAPFYITLPVSCARLLWPWGLLALLALFVLRAKQHRQVVRVAALWIVLSFLPYSFLTYMHRIPSRQTYLASLGLAWIVAAGFWALQSRLRLYRSAVIASVAAIVLASNIGYIWTKKRLQFADRAAPVEALVALAQRTNGPIYMRSFPDPQIVYESAVRMRLDKPVLLIWDEASRNQAAAEFAWPPRSRPTTSSDTPAPPAPSPASP